jgi:hypothetical protein
MTGAQAADSVVGLGSISLLTTPGPIRLELFYAAFLTCGEDKTRRP